MAAGEVPFADEPEVLRLAESPRGERFVLVLPALDG